MDFSFTVNVSIIINHLIISSHLGAVFKQSVGAHTWSLCPEEDPCTADIIPRGCTNITALDEPPANSHDCLRRYQQKFQREMHLCKTKGPFVYAFNLKNV